MTRILIPSAGPSQWQALLADPKKHWKRGRSAFELAVSWEQAQETRNVSGLPPEVRTAIDAIPPLKGAVLLLAVPERKVTLNNSRAPSQTDLWAVLHHASGLISLGIEGKAGEPFDDTVDGWLHQDEKKDGRMERLEWLVEKLKLNPSAEGLGTLRYQLVHRTASALKEAERIAAFAAIMLIQGFPGAENSWDDFVRFGAYLGVQVKMNGLVKVPVHEEPQLYIGWVTSCCATDEEIASSVVVPAHD